MQPGELWPDEIQNGTFRTPPGSWQSFMGNRPSRMDDERELGSDSGKRVPAKQTLEEALGEEFVQRLLKENMELKHSKRRVREALRR